MLFDNPRPSIDFEAVGEPEVRRAVEELARLFDNAPGVFKDALDSARAGAETLSGDCLRVLTTGLRCGYGAPGRV
jgi:hypothetical protein